MNTTQKELRISAVPRVLELRQNADGSRSIAGEAVVYNALSEDLGGWREQFAPGAFRNSLRTTEVMALYSHDEADILGRQSSGTLTLTDGPDALRFECKLPNTTVGRDVQELCARGDLKGMSFGFTAVVDEFKTGADGTVVRTVLEATLYEISVVGNPAFSQTTVSLRSCPAALRSKLAQRSEAEKTKTVDGVPLPASSFAYVGDKSQPDSWKLPIHWPGDPDKTQDHIRLALAMFSRTEGIPDSEKAEVYARIVGAAKAHGIAVTHESLRDREDAEDWTDPDPYADDPDDLTGAVQGPFDADIEDQDADEDDMDGDGDGETDSLRSDRLRMNLYFANLRANLL